MEDKNYSKLLESIQKGDFCPILDLHYRLLAKSKYDLDQKYNCVFDAIDNPTEKERAEIREINARTDSTYINAGVVSPQEIRDVLRADEKSGYNALSEEPEGELVEPNVDIEGGSETSQDPFNGFDEWKEEDHPRKKNGQFGEGGGNGKSENKSEHSKQNQSETIAGVKKGKPMSFNEADSGNVNPSYDRHANNGYNSNCQTCIAVLEARLKGYDIEAKPFDANNEKMIALAHNPCLAYVDPKTGKNPEFVITNAKNHTECEKWLKNNTKYGERYAFGFRTLEGSAHIVEMHKTLTGKIEFYDPQNGEKYKSNFLKNMRYEEVIGQKTYNTSPRLFRTDDKDINAEFLNDVTKPTNKAEN